jgi:hypothetical protein
MTTTAVGTIAVVKDRVRDTLAALTAFRAWQGAAYSVEQAKARIYFDDTPLPPDGQESYTAGQLAALRPFAVVFLATPGGARWSADATPNRCVPSGRIQIYLEEAIPSDLVPAGTAAEDTGEVIRRFENFVGRLIQNESDPSALTFATTRAMAGYFAWKSISWDGPYRPHPQEVAAQGDHQYGLLTIDW